MDTASLVVGICIGIVIGAVAVACLRSNNPLRIQADNSARNNDSIDRSRETAAWKSVADSAIERGLPPPPAPWEHTVWRRRIKWGAVGAAPAMALYVLHVIRLLDVPAPLTGSP